MEIKDFKVGQEVAILRFVKSRPDVLVPAVIIKVGRKYVWAIMSDNRMDVQFENGADHGYGDRFIEHTQYIPEYFLYPTLQQANDAMEVEELQHWLRRTVQWHTIRTFTLEQLRAVKEILDPHGVVKDETGEEKL